ncbi:MAG TPA: hypothetical protein VGJ19_17230 [Streptosporangiaceae bacterium]|jgi:hypothetical protein
MLERSEPQDLSRAFRFQARHRDWSIRSVNGGAAFVAEQNGDHSAQVIACHSLGQLMDRLEAEVAGKAGSDH